MPLIGNPITYNVHHIHTYNMHNVLPEHLHTYVPYMYVWYKAFLYTLCISKMKSNVVFITLYIYQSTGHMKQLTIIIYTNSHKLSHKVLQVH